MLLDKVSNIVKPNKMYLMLSLNKAFVQWKINFQKKEN